jgi:hypothetical protein
MNKKKIRVVAMSHGDDPQFFVVPFLVSFLLGQKKVEGRRHESRRQPTFFVPFVFTILLG